jgi:hypothetical protein
MKGFGLKHKGYVFRVSATFTVNIGAADAAIEKRSGRHRPRNESGRR